jgi:hypothetical protein
MHCRTHLCLKFQYQSYKNKQNINRTLHNNRCEHSAPKYVHTSEGFKGVGYLQILFSESKIEIIKFINIIKSQTKTFLFLNCYKF